MSRSDVDDWLAECDDILDDWNGSADSATWAADGSHEPDQIGGDYYFEDRPAGLFQHRVSPLSWAETYVGPPTPSIPTVGDTEGWVPIGWVDEIRFSTEQFENVWRGIQGVFVNLARSVEAALSSWSNQNQAPEWAAPTDTTIRDDTLRELVPLNLQRHTHIEPPKPFPPFRHDEPTGRRAQHSTYGGRP